MLPRVNLTPDRADLTRLLVACDVFGEAKITPTVDSIVAFMIEREREKKHFKRWGGGWIWDIKIWVSRF